MKKNFLYLVMAAFVCLFAACSQEEIVSGDGQNKDKVNLSVKIPAAGPVARAADLSVAGYTMQCIMELVDAQGALIANSRQTTTVTNGTASFEFTKPSGEYSCLFWAEYLNGDGESFYKTNEGLTKVAYDGNKKNELFNNKAADAFCGKIASSGISAGINITLKRPFARIAISKADLATLGTGINQFTASLFSATDFNVFTAKAVATVNIKNTEVDNVPTPIMVDANNDYPFYCYVFSGDAIAKPSTIIFSDSKSPDTSKKTLSITVEQMKAMNNNTAVNLKPETSGGSDDKMNVDITIDGSFGNGGGTTDPDTPAALKIGDYLYTDGTWGTDATNAVAVVYHVGADENDKSIYSMLTKVNGYAVALTDAAVDTKYATTAWTATSITSAEQLPQNNKSGYLNSHLTEEVNGTAYNQLAPVKAALEYSVALTEGKTSGWYLPTVAQLEEIRTLKLTNITFAAKNYWSCVIATSGKPFYASFNPEDATNYGGSNKATASTTGCNIRAIITF